MHVTVVKISRTAKKGIQIMNRIDRCFEELKKQNRKALITCTTAGDPDMETTEQAVLELFNDGADIVELGVPFSDPIAEDLIIQKASLRSLEKGTTLDQIFAMIENVRKECDKPLVLSMYLNMIFAYGKERFFEKCSTLGIDGVIVPDMPFEEHDEIAEYADKYGVYSINILSPVSGKRVRKIAAASKGYLYCISSNQERVPNPREDEAFLHMCDMIRESSEIPFCMEYGALPVDYAGKAAECCDGIVIGSAIVDIMNKNVGHAQKKVEQYVLDVRKVLDAR